MTSLDSARRRVLPCGWVDFARQLGIWFGFLLAYQLARGIADRNPPRAFENGLRVIGLERHLHGLIELSFQRFVDSSELLVGIASWTYWNSEFTVVGLALLWVYLRRHEAFTRFRNTILVANVIGLVGYVALPTAPPRMFPDLGFDDTLSRFTSLNHGSGLINFLANPYAAMPSVHAADALIVGVMLAYLARRPLVRLLWLLWAPWVWFSVIATANHFWLDVAGGIMVALISAAVIYRHRLRAVFSSAAAF
jgi:membrane-associated phospholipid phosphatase